MSWFEDRYRHSLASHGIRTSYTHSPLKVKRYRKEEGMSKIGGDYDEVLFYFTDDYKVTIRKNDDMGIVQILDKYDYTETQREFYFVEQIGKTTIYLDEERNPVCKISLELVIL